MQVNDTNFTNVIKKTWQMTMIVLMFEITIAYNLL